MVEIRNLTRTPVDERFFKITAQYILKKEKHSKDNLSIALLSLGKIRELNKRYLNKDRPTDVLAFPDKMELGEIVICPHFIKNNSKNFKEELLRVLIHGILHVLGYRHNKKMFNKQEVYLKTIWQKAESSRA